MLALPFFVFVPNVGVGMIAECTGLCKLKRTAVFQRLKFNLGSGILSLLRYSGGSPKNFPESSYKFCVLGAEELMTGIKGKSSQVYGKMGKFALDFAIQIG
jgi:hypothetical protein